MPVHDWTRVPAGLSHDFHQTWTIHIKAALNAGLLPGGFSALVEKRAGTREGDVLAVESRRSSNPTGGGEARGLLLSERPSTSIVRRTSDEFYADLANRIVVRHHLGRVVAVIEVVSPGNKDSQAALRSFVEKSIDFLQRGIHLLIIDLFPPSPRDPFGIHKAIWDEIHEEDFLFPAGKDRILASYETGGERTAYVEPIAVGDPLPAMPLFLSTGKHVLVPLEQTYLVSWETCPAEMCQAVETGALPESDTEGDWPAEVP